MEKDTRSRKWLLTINNPQDHDMAHDRITSALETMPLVYSCLCDEVGVNGTYHTHVFLQGKNQIRFSTIKNLFPSAHIDIANGTAQQNRDYIRKEGKWAKDKKKETNLSETFCEFGECPEERPGRRTDIEDLYQAIKDGLSDAQILEAHPHHMLHLHQIEKARQVIIEARYRSEFRNLSVEYVWGKTETGKTRGVAEKYGYENIFRVTDYNHPFDGYRQQDIIVFEEFRSSLRIGDMLNYLDGHPLELPCRYCNKQACYTKVFLLTNIPIIAQYPEVQKDSPWTWEAFRRRIGTVRELKPEEKSVVNMPLVLNPSVHKAIGPELCAELGIPFLGGTAGIDVPKAFTTS